jgi:hypothetical protein
LQAARLGIRPALLTTREDISPLTLKNKMNGVKATLYLACLPVSLKVVPVGTFGRKRRMFVNQEPRKRCYDLSLLVSSSVRHSIRQLAVSLSFVLACIPRLLHASHAQAMVNCTAVINLWRAKTFGVNF